MIDFAGIVPNSKVDYPGKSCAVVYLSGCNFRCSFCNNKEIVTGEICKKIDVEEIVKPLANNFMIEAVCITGGEPLMQDETIKLIASLRKNTPLAIKLDTNGYFPDKLERVLPALSFISIDIKAPFEKYTKAVGVEEAYIISNLEKTLAIVKKCRFPKEARTVIVPGLNDTEEDIAKIAAIVRENKFDLYTLQQFRPENTLDPNYTNLASPSVEQMRILGKTAKSFLPEAKVRVATAENGIESIL